MPTSLVERSRNTSGAKPAPRYQLSPQFLAAIRSSRLPVWQLAILAGYPHMQTLSALLHKNVVLATPIHLERLGRLAAVLHFPAARIFRDGQHNNFREVPVAPMADEQ